MDKVFQGRVLITPKNPNFKPFEIPNDSEKSTYFCISTIEGEQYLYDGKTKESAGSSYPMEMVTILKEVSGEEKPYLEKTVIEKIYNPNYGDNRICKCGHSYYRHFDFYEDMAPVGCKYCTCYEFEERDERE